MKYPIKFQAMIVKINGSTEHEKWPDKGKPLNLTLNNGFHVKLSENEKTKSIITKYQKLMGGPTPTDFRNQVESLMWCRFPMNWNYETKTCGNETNVIIWLADIQVPK